MPLLFALSSSVFFGVADYFGGRATRQVDAIGVAIRAQGAGLVAMSVISLFRADQWTAEVLLWGSLAGAAGAIGLILFYTALAEGQMSVVAPIAAVLGAIVPLIIGLIQGERPSVIVLVAVVLGVSGVLLVSSGPNGFKGLQEAGFHKPVIYSATAGGLFGLFFVFVNETPESSGILAVVVSRSAGLICLLTIATITKQKVRIVTTTALAITIAAGLLDGGANILAILALHGELLSITAVILALYPASTLVLARFTLHERLLRTQVLGLALAAIAVAGIAIG